MTNGGATALDQLLPDYDIEREVGRGAMGVVYLGRHRRLDRPVAIKELQGALAADPATRERFGVEAKALAALDHPHVVPVYDFVERDQHLVLIMEQLPGGTVWDRFVSDGLTLSEATAITLATCSALGHAHAQGILHRDIKPENLMFAADGALKVTDFGIARMVNGASTKATMDGSVLGTPAYMAPEQAEGANVGPPADVYATATMLYEMMSGRLPFEQSDSVVAMLAARIGSDPIDLHDVAPRVPDQLAAATMRGLARDQRRRIATAEEFGSELGEAAAAAWGPEWLDASGLVVRGSERIDRAARTTGDGQRAADPSTATGRTTIVTGSADAPPPSGAGATLVPDAPEPPTDDDTADDTPAGETAPDAAPSGDEPTADTTTGIRDTEAATPTPPAPTGRTTESAAVAVRPQTSDRDLGRAVDVSGRELIDIAELTRVPRRPVATWAVGFVLLAAGLVWALIGGGRTIDGDPTSDLLLDGQPTSVDEPVELDLSQTFRVRGGPPDEPLTVSFEQLGVPLGSEEVVFGPDGSVEVDPGVVGNISTGAMTATLDVGPDPAAGSGQQVVTAVRATQPWYTSAVGIGAIVVVLFAFATIESNLRAFRRGRGGIGASVGLAIGGALLTAAVAIGSTVMLGRPHGLVGVIGPAVVGAAGAVAFGVAVAAGRRRRRIGRQNTRTAAIAKLQSR